MKSLAASIRLRTLFMMAAFRKRFLLNALFFAPQTGILLIPRLTIFDAGWENGRLRREVMRCNLKRRFFRPSFPSPSTSERARRRLKGRFERIVVDIGRSKENLREGLAENLKAKVSLEDSLSKKMCTMLTLTCGRRLQSVVFQFAPLNGRFHLLHKDQYLVALAHLVRLLMDSCSSGSS